MLALLSRLCSLSARRGLLGRVAAWLRLGPGPGALWWALWGLSWAVLAVAWSLVRFPVWLASLARRWSWCVFRARVSRLPFVAWCVAWLLPRWCRGVSLSLAFWLVARFLRSSGRPWLPWVSGLWRSGSFPVRVAACWLASRFVSSSSGVVLVPSSSPLGGVAAALAAPAGAA